MPAASSKGMGDAYKAVRPTEKVTLHAGFSIELPVGSKVFLYQS